MLFFIDNSFNLVPSESKRLLSEGEYFPKSNDNVNMYSDTVRAYWFFDLKGKAKILISSVSN